MRRVAVASGRAGLGAELGHPAGHHPDPDGLRQCDSDRVIDVPRRHAVRCCPTAEPGINHAAADLFLLRRVAVEA